MIGPIFWTQFSWESFATLATGGAAVFAAWRVGKRQAEIQKNQIELKEQEIKISLLERRLQVYDEVHRFISEVLTSGTEASVETSRQFHQAMLNAKFLFPQKVCQFLDEVWSKNCDMGLSTSMLKPGASKTAEEHKKYTDMRINTMKWFVDQFDRLSEHFADIKPIE